MTASHPHSVRVLSTATLSAAGDGSDALWDAALRAKPGQQPQDFGDPRFGTGEDAPQYAAYRGAHRRHTEHPEPAAAWLDHVCQQALTSANLSAASDSEGIHHQDGPPRVALMAGSSLGGMPLLEALHRRWWDKDGAAGPGLLGQADNEARPACVTEDPRGPTLAQSSRYDGPTVGAARGLDLKAGAWTLNTACSSATNALGLARMWLLRKRIDVAIVAGVDVVSPFVYAGFRCLGAIDAQPTTPFSAARGGLNLGDAAVALVLCRSEDAPADNKDAVDLIGYGSSCDAHHLTRPDLSGAGLSRAIEAALQDARVSASQVDAISAHGTGTSFNDTMEAAAFARLFAARAPAMPPMHCAKPIAGHTLGAAGAIDAIITIEAIKRAQLPPTYRRGDDDPELSLHPSATAQGLPPRATLLSTSSGFGGSNAALIFKGAEN